PAASPPEDVLEAAGLLIAARATGSQATETLDIKDDWQGKLPGFRLNATPQPTVVRVDHGGVVHEVQLSGRSIWDLPIAKLKKWGVFAYDYEGWSGQFSDARSEGGSASFSDGTILAPMPGKV